MFQPDLIMEKAHHFSRLDRSHALSPCSPHMVMLEETNWPSMEHYYQIHVAGNASQIAVLKSLDAVAAYRFARPWYRKKSKGWKASRRVLMTRAAYTKAQMYPEVKAFLMNTGQSLLVETSLYDYYWGIGRDQRGENMLGKIWMDVRAKLQHDGLKEKELMNG